MVDLETVRAAKAVLDERFAHDPRVNGVGIGRGDAGPVIRVHLTSASDRPEIEPEINGVPIQQIVIGRVTAQPL